MAHSSGSLGTGNVTVANILVGPGNLFYATVGTDLPTWTTGGALSDLTAATGWTSVGATMEGVEVGYQPDYGEVEVDQLKDAARLFHQGLTVTMNTNLAEATLENLLVAWGVEDGALHYGGDDSNVFHIAVPSDEPVERKLVVVGKAPDAGGNDRDRIYVAHRVISIEGSTHSLRRTEATMFPVSFRLLPDPSNVGHEYGLIIDHVAGDNTLPIYPTEGV